MSGTRETAMQFGLVVLLIISLISRSPLLLTFTILLCLTFAATYLWSRYALDRLEYKRSLSQERCFVGDEVTLTVELSNKKILPVTYLTVDDQLSDRLEIKGRKVRFLRIGKGVLRLLFGLGWYQKVIRRYTLQPMRRGFYQIGPATISGGDPFGYVEKTLPVPEVARLLVYPRIVPLERVGIPSRKPFGDLKSNNRLFEDPMRFAGVREYQPGDPLNRVHWKATAAAGRIQVRVLDPSSTVGLAVFLNTWSFERSWLGTDPDAFEAGCSLAASVVNWGVQEGLPVGLYANGVVQDWGLTLRIPPARGPEVLPHALEGLARLLSASGQPLESLLVEEVPRLGYGTGVVIITRMVSPELAAGALNVQRTGRPVTLVVTSPEQESLPRMPGVRVYRVAGEEGLHGAVLA